jgi:hypothetical protein
MAKPKKLKPTGHSAVIEALIQPAIVIGSTLMSAIAAYELGVDELAHILAGQGSGADVFVVVLCAGMGFLIDMAIIISATRYTMHTVRADPRELQWKHIARWVLLVGLASESMTFFVHLNPVAFPGWLQTVADLVHSVLTVSRAFLPPVIIAYFVAGILPVIIAYFVAGILPVIIERGDRNREIKVRTSQNIMLLNDLLSQVERTDDKQEMLKALGGQLMLDTYATYDATDRTSETDQVKRDVKLLKHLAKLNGLNWDFIAEMVEETPARVVLPAAADEREDLDALPLFNGHQPSVS